MNINSAQDTNKIEIPSPIPISIPIQPNGSYRIV